MPARFLRHSRLLPFGTRLLLAAIGSYCAAILLFMLTVYSQWSGNTEQQADALGQTIIRQTANEAIIAMAAEDTLALNILLRELSNNPYINYSVVYSADNQVIAAAGKASDAASYTRTYSQQLTFQRVLAGNLQIQLDIRPLQQPMYKSLQSILLIAALILAALFFVLQQLIKGTRRNLRTLDNWLLKPTTAAPLQQLPDEIGLLARHLNQLLAPPLLQEVVQPAETAAPEADDTQNTHEADSEPEPAPVAQYAIALAVQPDFEQTFELLDSSRQQQLLDTYQHAVHSCARLYQARLKQLPGQHNLLLFDDLDQHYVRHAICAGELLRAFAHQLQVELADSSCKVSLRLALSQGKMEDGEDALGSKAMELSSYSRNLVLLCDSLSADPRATACARLRSISRPANTNCVEQLLSAYLAQLDSQLKILRRD